MCRFDSRLDPPMNYCEKCKKIVLDSEVKEFTIFNKKSKLHFTSKTVNFYTQGGRYQAPGKIGFDPVTETRYCGSVKEVEDGQEIKED